MATTTTGGSSYTDENGNHVNVDVHGLVVQHNDGAVVDHSQDAPPAADSHAVAEQAPTGAQDAVPALSTEPTVGAGAANDGAAGDGTADAGSAPDANPNQAA